MTKAYMIIDLQFGSTGKGLLAGYLAKRLKPDVVATAWSPNAGHTYIDENGRKFVHCMLANSIVSPSLTTVLIGAGSTLDLDLLYKEIESCADLLRHKTIIIHPHAAVVTQAHRDIEKRNVKIGSTMKGSGASAIQRMERDPDNNPTVVAQIDIDWLNKVHELGIHIVVDAKRYDLAISTAKLIAIEGAQGYSLSMYHGFYPYTTSRDVTPHQTLADTCMPYGIDCKIFGTMRTFPIRVANRYNEEGEMIGTSGRVYDDQQEISWEGIGLEPELTTVTKLPRRIFTFSMEQAREAYFRCQPDVLFLNFVNYQSIEENMELIDQLRDIGYDVALVGTGATHNDVKPTHGYAIGTLANKFRDLWRTRGDKK